MSLVLKINGVDRSSSINWPTLVKTEVLTKEVDRLEFLIKKTATKTIPEPGDEILLLEGSDKIFGGIVVEQNEKILGGLLVGYEIKCKDWSHLLDRKVVVRSYGNPSSPGVPYIRPDQIVTDIISAFTTGFTVTNVKVAGFQLASMKFNYEPVSRCLSQLADQIGWDWYVDADKDIHFFDEETMTAPFDLTDTNEKYQWRSLEINKTIVNLKNTIYVRGGEYKKTIAEGSAQDVFLGNGTQVVFPLSYKYDNLSVKNGGVLQTIGTDQQTEPGTVNVLYNFNEKFIRFDDPPADGVEVKVYGDAYIPIIALVRDQVSIAAYGTYEDVILEKSITSIDEAQSRARAELLKYAASVHEARFKTTETGLRTGQKIRVQSDIRGIDKVFKITRIVGKARTKDQMEYEVFLLASGQINFVDIMVALLGRDKRNIVLATNEVLQRIEAFYEEIDFDDGDPSGSATTGPYYWYPATAVLLSEAGDILTSEAGDHLTELFYGDAAAYLKWGLGVWG